MDRYVKNETTGAADTAPVFKSREEIPETTPAVPAAFQTASASFPSASASFPSASASFSAASACGLRLSVTVFDQEISAYILIPDEGIHVTVCGGEKSHIGAVSVIGPDGIRHDSQFPGHKDGVVAAKWANALHEAGYSPVTAEAGIHYDDLSKDSIAVVVDAADALLIQVLAQLSDMPHD